MVYYLLKQDKTYAILMKNNINDLLFSLIGKKLKSAKAFYNFYHCMNYLFNKIEDDDILATNFYDNPRVGVQGLLDMIKGTFLQID